MRPYGKSFNILLCMVLCLGLMWGCSGANPSAESGEPYYYAEFDDVPIPSELGGIKETTTITTPGGVKAGFQVFKGRAEVGSLNKAMVGHMQRDGWELRSSTRGVRSFLLFEKEDRYCSIYIMDGMFNTEMEVYVSPKLGSSGGARGSQGYSSNPSNSFDSQSLSE